jgi:hypothetical protein
MSNEVSYPHRTEVAVDHLKFDPLNPRLPYSIRKKSDDPREILNWMLDDAGVIDLMRSIGVRNYFDGEPLLAIPVGDNSGDYIVVEGNRRLAALKLLLEPELASDHAFHSRVRTTTEEANFKPQRVPVIVYGNREAILSYLGYRHITGVKAWSALAKSRYLNDLLSQYPQHEPKEQHKLLAKNIGSTASYVAKLLAGLKLYETVEANNFYGIKGLDEEEVDFSLITTALGYSNIQKFLGLESSQDINQSKLNQESLKQFTIWLFDKNPTSGKSRLEDSRNLGKLNAIVGSKEALAYFQERSFSIHQASLFTDEPLENYRKLIVDIRQKLQATQETLNLIREFSKSDLDDLDELANRVKNIRGSVREQLETEIR